MGVFLYGLSWGSSSSRAVPQPTLIPILAGYGLLVTLIGFFLGANINGTIEIGGVVDYPLPGWDSIEVGVFGSLLIAGLPFFMLSQTRPGSVAGPTLLSGVVSLSAGLVFLSTTSLWVMFISFEFLLLSALYMLLLTSKSERARDAALEMFIWTLVGSAGLLTGLGLIGGLYGESTSPSRWSLLGGVCFLVGFGVKVPLWPATSWLLKAHVEASVEFSILLSGYIVKVGVLGLYRTLAMAESPSLNLLASSLAVIGLFDAGSRLPAQRDMKRIVALTTVIEMN